MVKPWMLKGLGRERAKFEVGVEYAVAEHAGEVVEENVAAESTTGCLAMA